MSGRLEQMYAASPAVLQNVLCSGAGARNYARRYLYDFDWRLAAYEERLSWPEHQLSQFRDEQLVKHAQHAVRTVPYYRDLASRHGFTTADLRSSADVLEIFPVLQKDEVRDLGAQLCSDAVRRRHRTVLHTSGTTGSGLNITTTHAALRDQWAVAWRFWRILGIKRTTSCGWLAGRTVVPPECTRPPFWRHNIIGRQILYSGYHLAPQNLSYYIDHIERSRLSWLHGYPSSVSLLAVHMLEHERSLGNQITHVTLSSENLTEVQRTVITRAFGVEPRRYYGNTECIASASECPYGTFHIDEDYAYAESINDGSGEAGVLVGTNFTNFAFPLIRYQVGDRTTIENQRCPCGRAGRALASIDGRLEDVVTLASGVRIGRLDHIFKELHHIREAQIYQPRRGAIVLRVVRGDGHSQRDDRQLAEAARRRLGDEVDISIVHVDQLPRSQNGKLRMVVSDIADGMEAVVSDVERESTTRRDA